MTIDMEWTLRASCRGSNPEALYVDGAAQHEAKRICEHCPVRYRCLAEALDAGDEHGVWGGMTDRERRALRKQHPRVTSWRDLFAEALGPRAQVWALGEKRTIPV
ncbi:WhiB family transcriptional regulator [Longispora sp. NPDC051575]|jgi:WhiB family redox-sensing transcriptional regulator|uniref:WhiB family transcriptional regulator n=1 Tax=Longispora sp. NPDC051575 TaxID=3154943 RepID=UPI003431FE52